MAQQCFSILLPKETCKHLYACFVSFMPGRMGNRDSVLNHKTVFYSAQQLDFFVWCVRLLVCFRMHLKSMSHSGAGCRNGLTDVRSKVTPVNSIYLLNVVVKQEILLFSQSRSRFGPRKWIKLFQNYPSFPLGFGSFLCGSHQGICEP